MSQKEAGLTITNHVRSTTFVNYAFIGFRHLFYLKTLALPFHQLYFPTCYRHLVAVAAVAVVAEEVKKDFDKGAAWRRAIL